jgi:hypothetical protein
MEQLKLFCEPIAFICRVRYEIYITEYSNKEEICEKLDENIYIIFDRMKKFFSLNNENVSLFKLFFFDCLDNIEDIVSIDIDIISELAEECYKNNYYEKYELIYINGSYKYITKKVIYEESSVPGLDFYGNISLDSKLEIPVLQGGFNYYPEKNIPLPWNVEA